MAFDFDGAEAAGLSQEAILKELEKSGKVSYDFTGARKAGISTNEIYSTIKTKMSQPTDLPTLPDELPDIVPGPPEEYDNGLVGETSVGEITVLPETNTIPENQQLDLQTTATSQPMISEKGQLTTTTDLPMSMEEEAARRAAGPEGLKAMQASGLQQPPEGIAYRDPKTGEVVSTAMQSGGIEPAYDILFGPAGKLGVFGVLSPLAGIEAGKIVGKKSAEVAQAIDDLFQQHPAASLGDALSKEAKYILNRNPNITEDQVLEALQGVKTEDQAYALSRMLGETGYIRQAVRADSDAAAGALRADLEVARDKILQTVGTVDIAHAKAKYADMMATFDYDNVHNAKPILQDLDFLERFYGVTPSTGNRVVTQMKAALSDNPNISIKDALEFRGDLNYLIGKATRGREKVKLNSIKENLDGFINSVATPEQKTMIDDAIGTYARTMQNRDVLDLVTKNTKDGIAVNWTKLHRDLNEANLRSPEAVDALRIAEAFSKRFGNDKKLLNIAMPQGSSPDSGGVLGAWGYVINHLKDTLAIYGNRAENLKIQKAILKSIKSGTTNLDFVNKLKANSDVPEEVSKIFEDLLQIPYKAGARQTGDVNLEPIVTPVGGTEKAVPTKVVDDVIPPLGENKALQQSLDEIPTKPSSETPYNPSNPESGIQVANEIYRQGSHLAERRIEELMSYNALNPAETAELRTLQDHMIEAGTGHKDDVVRTTPVHGQEASSSQNIAETLSSSTRARHLARISDYWDELKLNEFKDYPFDKSFDELDFTDPSIYNKLETWLSGHNMSIRERLEQQATFKGSGSSVVDSLRTAIKSGAKVYPDLSEEELKALSATFPSALRIELMEAERDLQKALMNDIEDLQPFHERIEAALDRGVRAKWTTSGPAIPTQTPIQRAEETFNTLRRDIQRLERVRVADRTPQQVAQLSEMRRERLLASREVERLRAGGEGADRLFNSFRSSDHTIEVTDRGNGSFTLKFNGARVPMSISTRNNTVSLNTQDFAQGSGQGAQFYKEFYKALDTAGLKHNVSGLTSVNQMRLPINIYKHKLDTGNLPITGGQQTLQRLMRSAINKINEVSGREIKHLTDGQLEELAKRTGPMRDVHAGVASLKLYRKAARLLSDGRALSVGALAPFINQAYSEIEED